MRSILFEARTEVTCEKVHGSGRKLVQGVAWTKTDPGTCNPLWFVGDTTTIVGAENPDPGPTIAKWNVPVDPAVVDAYESALLVICCERTHGGLHTSREGAAARVSINGHNRDLIALKDEPNGHRDFFHRLPNPPQLPDVWPVNACPTVYSWPVGKQQLTTSGIEVVEVELEENVAWDVDYVCLLISRTSYRVRDACKQIAYVLLGVVLGAIASLAISI